MANKEIQVKKKNTNNENIVFDTLDGIQLKILSEGSIVEDIPLVWKCFTQKKNFFLTVT